VRILATRNKGKPDSQTTVLVEAAMVQAIGRERRIGTTGLGVSAADAASANADSPVIWLTLLIGDESALELSNARWNGDLDIVLLPPAGIDSDLPAPAGSR
jgi:hypothetical protein